MLRPSKSSLTPWASCTHARDVSSPREWKEKRRAVLRYAQSKPHSKVENQCQTSSRS